MSRRFSYPKQSCGGHLLGALVFFGGGVIHGKSNEICEVVRDRRRRMRTDSSFSAQGIFLKPKIKNTWFFRSGSCPEQTKNSSRCQREANFIRLRGCIFRYEWTTCVRIRLMVHLLLVDPSVNRKPGRRFPSFSTILGFITTYKHAPAGNIQHNFAHYTILVNVCIVYMFGTLYYRPYAIGQI